MANGESIQSLRFFVSYTGADRAWAEWIASQLENAGHRVVVQAWDFRPGENFIANMRRARDTSDRTIVVVSAAYLESVYGSDEWTAAFIHDQAGQASLLAVRVQDVPLPRLLRPWASIDLVGVDQEVATQRLLEGVRPGRRRPEQPPVFPSAMTPAPRVGEPSFPGQGRTISNLPPRNPAFTGRDALLAELHAQLAAADTSVAVVAHALYGLGGVGKTQLALEYAHRYAADYELVWWIPAEQPLAIPGFLAALGRHLGVRELPNSEEQLAALFDELNHRDRWLLVYDNAQDPAVLADVLPRGGRGHVLITSRNPAWGAIAITVHLDILARQESTAFLLRRSSLDEATANALAEALGDLPLALEQAAAYLAETGAPPAVYLELLSHRSRELLALGRPVDSEHTVATTWSVSLAHLQQQLPIAQDLLALFAFLAPEPIPRGLVSEHIDVLPEQLRDAVADVIEYDSMLGALRRFSLIELTPAGLSVHLLVQAVVRASLPTKDEQRWAGFAVRLLEAAFPNEPWDVATWSVCAELLPHALAAANHAEGLGAEPETTGRILQRASGYLWGHVELPQAKALAERALIILEMRLGPHDLDVALSVTYLGVVLRDLADLAGAQAAHERALRIREELLGPDHAAVAASLNNLGIVLGGLGDLVGARAALDRALVIREARQGPDHPDVAAILSNFGNVLRGLGDLAGARAALERALRIREARLGPDHPDVAGSLNEIGVVLRGLGDLAGARAALERALRIREARLGPDHPNVATSLANLGVVLDEIGDLVDARGVMERALRIREARLGSDHPDVAASRESLEWVVRRLEGSS